MAGARKRKRRGGGCYRDYEGWYYDRFGRRVFFKGFKTKQETLEVAYAKEAQERKARLLGFAPEQFVDVGIESVYAEYSAWGNSSGGRGGCGWSPVHARMRKTHLAFWKSQLTLERVSDLKGRLADAESVLRMLSALGRSRKTVFSYGEALKAFCRWCVEREFLDADPVAKLDCGSPLAVRRRRPFTSEELRRILQVATRDRRLLYVVAVTTGFRVRELGALRVGDFDGGNARLRLAAEWTKNRRDAMQPLPSFVVAELSAHCAGRNERDKLLMVPSHGARALSSDLAKAGIEKRTGSGVVDFHSFRVTYVTMLAESGAHPGEVQELARHANPDLTFGLYARPVDERKLRAVQGTFGSLER